MGLLSEMFAFLRFVLGFFGFGTRFRSLEVPSISVLNTDCLALILRQLTLEELVHFELVCKQWQHVIRERVFRGKFFEL